MTAHWGVPDPAAVIGSQSTVALAFADAFRMLNNRIGVFISLPIAKLDRLTLQRRVEAIGTARPEDTAA